jgi:hypothetical protein
VNETWFEFVNVAVSDLADAGPLAAGAERKLVRPDAVAVSKRPTAIAPRTAVIVAPLKARFLIPVPSQWSISARGGAGDGSRSPGAVDPLSGRSLPAAVIRAAGTAIRQRV